MKKLNGLLFLALLLLAGSCKNDSSPNDGFETGAYPKLIDYSGELKLDDIAVSKVAFSVEFVDGNDGKDVVEYSWGVIHPAGENIEKPLITLAPNVFGTTADGVVSADVEITFQQILDALGYTAADVSVGDLYRFNGKLVMSDGDIFDVTNTSVEIINNFGAFFNFDETVK